MWRTDHFVANPAAVYNGNMTNGGWGGLGIPQHFVDKFIANDGLESHRLKGTMVSIEDVVYNFEYLNADINAMTLEQKKASSMDSLSILMSSRQQGRMTSITMAVRISV